MRVLNAYAGIGGNRHLWPAEWDITAVELDERIAAEYARRYPQDQTLVEDAHAFVLERAHQFDAVWTSPPCPTHSRIQRTLVSRFGKTEPDPRLWLEIEHLQQLGRRYVVENVHTYYAPPIAPDVVTDRHYYWVSAAPALINPYEVVKLARAHSTSDEIADSYGLERLAPGSVSDRRKTMRNAVVPLEGLQIAEAAFEAPTEDEVRRYERADADLKATDSQEAS